MLQFISGLAIGIFGVIAYKNNDKVREQVQKGACIIKKLTKDGLEKSKEAIVYVKQRIEESKCKTQETSEEKPKSTRKSPPKKDVK